MVRTKIKTMVDHFCQTAFIRACEAVLPNRLVAQTLSVSGSELMVKSGKNLHRFPLKRNVYVAAFGKAAPGMCRAVDNILDDHVVGGYASVQIGALDTLRKNSLWDQLPKAQTRVKYLEGAANNLPDAASAQAASEIETLAKALSKDDMLIVLASGGGSALLPAPVDGVSLEDKLQTIRLLGASGATIEQLNTVRQNLSRLKGGRLALLAYPAKVIGLIFSDIIGNDISFVASGPTTPAHTKRSDAWKIIDSFGLTDKVPSTVRSHLTNTNADERDKAQSFEHVLNVLIGDSAVAINHVKQQAVAEQYQTNVLTMELCGEASEAGRSFAQLLQQCTAGEKTVLVPAGLTTDGSNLVLPIDSEKLCFICGGETIVNVRGKGKGGRNQEMVLSFLIEAQRLGLAKSNGCRFAFLSAGTDGQDGPTDAAGALVTETDVLALGENGHLKNASNALNNNDSYNFFSNFRQSSCHIKPGLTGTNVMDIQILAIDFN